MSVLKFWFLKFWWLGEYEFKNYLWASVSPLVKQLIPCILRLCDVTDGEWHGWNLDWALMEEL